MLRVSVLRAGAAVCATVVALTLASCGQSDGEGQRADDPVSESTGPTGDPAPAGTPECATVWQAGERIPRGYQGCADEAGVLVERDALGCSSGQRMIRYGDRFWGVAGGTVNEAQGPLDGDRDYRASMRNCSA